MNPVRGPSAVYLPSEADPRGRYCRALKAEAEVVEGDLNDLL